MTDTKALAVVEQPQAIARRQPSDVTDRMTFAEMVAMGDHLVRTNFLPEHIRNGQQFAAIVLDGRERGMLPMRAIRSLQMVKGKVIESADSQLARFKADGGRAVFQHLDDTKAVLWLRHPNGDEHVETWTIEDSKRAGLAGNMHGKFPKAMFRSRAITAGLKSIGWEGSVGTYDADELPTEAPPSTTTTTIRVEPPADIKDVRDRVGALFATLEMSTKEARVDFMRRITGKDSGFELADYLDVEEALKSAAAAKVAPDEVQP
jgi:hypothetical protein